MPSARAKLAGALLAIEVAAALVLAYGLATLGNTIERGGTWVATKAQLEKGVLGARAFATSWRTLGKGRVDLGRWNGFQEIVRAEREPVASFEFRFRLARYAYLVCLFDASETGRTGVRLGTYPRFPAIAFATDAQGRFVRREAVDLPLLEPDAWHAARVEFHGERARLWVDGAPVGTFAAGTDGERAIGLRGSLRSAVVDDIVVRRADGSAWREDFFDQRGFARWLALALAAFVVIDVALFVALRRASARTLVRIVGLALGALVAALAVAWAARGLLADAYPAEDDAGEHAWVDAEAEEIARELERRFGEPKAQGERRVLFLGTSQTWGAGAARAEETYPSVLARRLGFAALNAGISGARSPRIAALHRERLLALEPDAVVVDLSNNDDDEEAFARALREIVALNGELGIPTLFALEPNSIESRPEPLPLHATMRAVAQEAGVPVVDVHGALLACYDDGLVWWDFVHPTSFGHRLIADALEPEIGALLGLRPR